LQGQRKGAWEGGEVVVESSRCAAQLVCWAAVMPVAMAVPEDSEAPPDVPQSPQVGKRRVRAFSQPQLLTKLQEMVARREGAVCSRCL